MQVWIGYTKKDKRCIEKKPKWVHKLKNIEIWGDCDFNNPVFIVDSKYVESNTNYVYCNDFNRYYYVNNIVQNGHVCMIHCHVDVLQSYQNNIYSLQTNIARIENKNLYNSLIADERIISTVKKRVHYYSVNAQPFSTTGNGRPIVLTVSGGGSNETN